MYMTHLLCKQEATSALSEGQADRTMKTDPFDIGHQPFKVMSMKCYMKGLKSSFFL